MRFLFITLYNPDNYGVRCLASQLLEHGHEVHILQLKNHMQTVQTHVPLTEPMLLFYANGPLVVTDLDAKGVTPIEQALFVETIARWCPDVIGFSFFGVHQQLFPQITALAAQACPHAFLLAGGGGPTLDPLFYLRHGAEAVIRGEGEDALPEVLTALENQRPWQDIRNVSYLRAGTLHNNPLRPLECDLSRYPVPYHGMEYYSCIEDNTHYHAAMSAIETEKNPIRPDRTENCLTSRGCLGACTYCSAESLRRVYTQEYPHTPKLRLRTLDHIFKEFHELKRQDIKFIYINDDFFVRPQKEMHAFLKRYAEEIALPFYAYFHPQQLLHDPSLIPHIMRAGCTTFSFGIQSGSEHFCNKVYQRKFFSRKYAELFATITAHGGDIRVHFIGGNPLETQKEFQENLEFCRNLPFDASQKTITGLNIFYLMFLPGAKLAELYPKIQSMPRSMTTFYYQSLLMDIRRMTTDEIFETITNNKLFTEEPQKLLTLRTVLMRDLRKKYLYEQASRLEGKDVYFWGCGEMYLFRKHLFVTCKPQCILVDVSNDDQKTMDGIPVMHPDAVLPLGPVLPIVIFSKHARNIFLGIKKKYPQYTDIVVCTEL